MRYIFVRPDGILDTDTGELHSSLSLSLLLTTGNGGIIAGRNLYPVLSSLSSSIRADTGWTMIVHAQQQKVKRDRVGGIIYYSRLSYRPPKIGGRKNRRRPPAIKWLVLNLELFSESDDIEASARSIVKLCLDRGIRPRYSPGTISSALLRASPAWESGRGPAPRFISEAARPNLPGNLYLLRHRYKSAARALYIDQSSSHHTIASQIPLPHPAYLRARGRFRSVEAHGLIPNVTDRWLGNIDLLTLHRHIGVIVATVEIDALGPTETHLYPKWAQKSGTRQVWIWTPELRLIERRIRIVKVTAALTSFRADPVLSEYAQWSLDEIRRISHTAIKPALLAAYGMLAVRSRESFNTHTIHGRSRPPRAEEVRFPLVDGAVFRSTVEGKRTPVIQNVVARGVIEAECQVRSLELARELESMKMKVLQIYADGIIVETDQVPILPPNWRVTAELTNLIARNPSSVLSDNLVKLPGIPNGRRMSIVHSSSGVEVGRAVVRET